MTRAKGLIALATLAAGLFASAPTFGQDPADDWELRSNPRDFHIPGYHRVQAISFRLDEVLGPTGLIVDNRYVPIENNAELSGKAKARVDANRRSVDQLCAVAAKGSDGEYDHWSDLSPERLVFLAADRRSTSRMIVYRGRTSYVGPEDQNPGRFECVLRNGTVVSWVFHSDDEYGR